MFTQERRAYKRTPFIVPMRYSVTSSNMEELDKFHNDGISVDVSEGGLGMITDCPLKIGDILTFEYEIKVKKIVANTSIVRWIKKIENNRYRVGLEFFRRLRVI